MNAEIRLKYSGLLIFLSRILSIFTGLVFSVILTHSLSKPEFGAWTNIVGVLGTFGIASGIFPFWAARYTARKFEGAMKLGLLANLGISVPAAAIVVLLAPLLATAANTSTSYYLIAAVLVIQSHVIISLDAVVTVVKTHIIGYAYLMFEIIKIGVAYPLIVFLHWGISAALSATFVANVGWTLLYVIALSKHWHQKIDYRHISDWIRGSPLNLYAVGAGLLAGLEGYILLFRGGGISLAYYGAAALVTGPIGYTISLSAALYPRLLSGGRAEDAETVMRLSLLFSIPLTLATIALASSLLAILNIGYVLASFILALLAVRGFAYTFGGMFDAIISGMEKLDAEGRIRIGQVPKSRIFLSTTTAYGIFPIYLPLLWVLLQPLANDPIGAARTTAFAGLCVTLLSVAFKYLISKRSLSFRFPIKSAAKFLVVALILVSPTLFVSQPMQPSTTIALFTIGTVLYFLLLYLIDDEVKIIIQSIWQHRVSLLKSRP